MEVQLNFYLPAGMSQLALCCYFPTSVFTTPFPLTALPLPAQHRGRPPPSPNVGVTHGVVGIVWRDEGVPVVVLAFVAGHFVRMFLSIRGIYIGPLFTLCRFPFFPYPFKKTSIPATPRPSQFMPRLVGAATCLVQPHLFFLPLLPLAAPCPTPLSPTRSLFPTRSPSHFGLFSQLSILSTLCTITPPPLPVVPSQRSLCSVQSYFGRFHRGAPNKPFDAHKPSFPGRESLNASPCSRRFFSLPRP